MKNLEEYKKESIKPNKSEPGWELLFEELRNQFRSWGYLGKYSDIDMSDYTYPLSGQFEPDFFKEYIKKALNIPKDNPLYDNIIEIVKVSDEPLGYHGSSYDKYLETWEFQIHGKQEIISKQSGSWIYNHFEIVKNFLEKDDYYNELTMLKSFFPVSIEKN